MERMTPLARAIRLQNYADGTEMWEGAPEQTWDEVADAYLVAADAWLEANDPEAAAHALLQAAEYRRWALDERANIVPGGIRRSIDHLTGEDSSYLPILSLAEAATIANLAGWLEPRGKGLVGLGHLRPVDRTGRPNDVRLDWLNRMTRVPVGYPPEIRDILDRIRFRELLYRHRPRRR